jgi:signal transduction histidine kinase
MLFGHPESRFRSLHFRLTFWNTLVILVLLLGTLVGLREGLIYTLRREMDALLAEDVEEVRLVVARFSPNWSAIKEALDRKAVSHKARSWFVCVWDEQGQMQAQTIGDYTPEIPPEEAPRQPFDEGGNRVYQTTLTRAPPVIVRVGCSRAFVDDDVLTLTKMLFVAALVIVVVAPVTGYWLAGWVTRPLHTMLHTTARLRPGALRERVPLRGNGDELDQMAGTLNSLLDRLEAHLDRQRAFVANAAHELRSPLASLRTLAEVALTHDRTPEEYRECLADIIEGCEGLGVLVNQLLLLAEGEASLVGAMGAVRLDQLAARAVDMFGGTAEVRGVKLRTGSVAPTTARGNETHLRQVVNNLIDNAIKFTPAGGTVEVEVRPASGDRPAVLRVRDTGVGISAEDLPHVFERFYRADKSRTRGQWGGYGLGLSICQAIVSAHGGEIQLTSRPGQGTTVTVLLPGDGEG